MRLKAFLLLLASFLASGVPAFAESENITDNFVSRFDNYFTGSVAERGWTSVDKDCITRVAGSCKAALVTQAKGWIQVDQLVRKSGRIFREITVDPIRGTTGYKYFSDLKLDFDYSGWSTAKKYEDWSGTIVDFPWGDTSPHGTLHLRFDASEDTNFIVEVAYTAKPGHDSKAHDFIAYTVAEGLKSKIQDALEAIVGYRPKITFN